LAVVEQRSGTGLALRGVVALVMTALVIAPVLTVASWAAQDTGDSLAFVDAERQGVEYLKPLTRLLGELVKAQSAAVGGEAVDTGQIQAAMSAVEQADAKLGGDLSAHPRFAEVRNAVRDLSQQPGGAGLDAFQRWAKAVDLTIALARRVGDTSKLILDPALDTYYLMDASLLRLPDVIQGAGQLADLLAITAGKRTPLDEVRAAVARDRIATAAAAVNLGLGKVVDVTGSRRVSSALLSPVDQFGAAVDALAPPLAVVTMPPLPDNVAAAAVGVRDSAQRLSQVVLGELDALLADRSGGLSRQRVYIALAAAVGVLVGAAVGVLAWRRRRDPDAVPAGPAPGQPAARQAGPRYPGYPGYGRDEDAAIAAMTGPPRAPVGTR
jgi:hypothetical protein